MIFHDKRVIRQIRLGDKEALQALYQTHKEDLYLLAYAMLRDRHSAEDVVHDIFVSFVQSVRTLNLKSSLKSYLATSAANRARDILRKCKFTPADIESCPEPAAIHNPAEQMEKSDLSDKLVKGLVSLPPEQSEAILLRIRNNMSFRQIAEFLNISASTAQGRYRYGLDKLRSMLNGEMKNGTDR
jgi:RNA polymerase sigma-70 factor (ECF subfamily)